MAIMTGVQSAQILGPTTQKQANASRQALDTDEVDFDAANNVGEPSHGHSAGSDSEFGRGTTDGGTPKVEKNNGLDVIR